MIAFHVILLALCLFGCELSLMHSHHYRASVRKFRGRRFVFQYLISRIVLCLFISLSIFELISLVLAMVFGYAP